MITGRFYRFYHDNIYEKNFSSKRRLFRHRTTCQMRSFLSITLILVYLVHNAIAGPPIIPREQHLGGEKAVSLEQYRGDSRQQLLHQDVDIKHKQENKVEMRQKQDEKLLLATSFQLFSMYDNRGPWQLSFLPQAPPQIKSVESSKVHQEVPIKVASD